VASNRDHKIFSKNQSIRGFCGFKSSFKNCFWNLFSILGLSQIWKIKNVWTLSSPFPRNTLIASSEKTSCCLKTLFWKLNWPINSKIAKKNFYHIRLPWLSLIIMVEDIQARSLKTLSIFELLRQFFIQKDSFKLQEDFLEKPTSKVSFLKLQIWTTNFSTFRFHVLICTSRF
jgi:hypothetical protein